MPYSLPLSPKNRFALLSEVAASPVDSPQFPLTVQMASSFFSARGAEINAEVHFDPTSMLVLQDNGLWTGAFEVVFIQLNDKRKILDVTQKDVSANLDSSEIAKLSQKGLDLPASLKFMPGATALCVILHDKSSDSVGSVHIPSPLTLRQSRPISAPAMPCSRPNARQPILLG
jgi:hypothetical protein